MPAVTGVPAETACVQCGQAPLVAFAYAGVEGRTGRVCAEHAEQEAPRRDARRGRLRNERELERL